MSKKRVKFSENLVSDVFEFEKDYPHELNHIASNLMKRVKPSTASIQEQTMSAHYCNIEMDEVGDKNVDFTGCLLDNETRDERLDVSQISGQENATITHDGEIKITPFNLNEEMEYGHFDSTGNFLFNKEEQTNIQDNWLDNVEWDKVKERSVESKQYMENDEKNDEENDEIDTVGIYNEILNMLNNDETVLKAIIRYGKSDKVKLETLTEFADKLLTNGDVNVYDFSKAAIQHKLTKLESITNFDDDLENAFCHKKPIADKDKFSDDKFNGDNDTPLWEYKWENINNAQIYGPFTTEQMAEWKNNGFFQTTVYCRKIVSNTTLSNGGGDKLIEKELDFHSSDRIDFELYL